MSSYYLNGASYPKFMITDANYVVKDTIILPLTNSKGLIETHEEQNIFYTYLNFKREKKILGYNVNFTLYYDEFVSKSTLLSIYKLLHWEYSFRLPEYENYRIFLYPRADMMSRYYEVIGRNETINLALLKGGTLAGGHKGIILNYTTKYLSNLNWQDPDVYNTVPFDNILTT